MPRSTNLSARIDPNDFERLQAIVDKRGNIKMSDLTREIVSEFLNDDTHDELGHQLDGLGHQLDGVRSELSDVREEVTALKDGMRNLHETGCKNGQAEGG